MCCTHSVLLLYADGATLCVPYSTLPYSLLLGCGPALLYGRLTLHDPILGCSHTLSLRRCGDCLICVFLILYLYNVVSGDCGPHFVFTPRILCVTWVSKPLLTLPLPSITTTRHYHYSTLHDLPTLPLLSPQLMGGTQDVAILNRSMYIFLSPHSHSCLHSCPLHVVCGESSGKVGRLCSVV